jgi:hypothetical protein
MVKTITLNNRLYRFTPYGLVPISTASSDPVKEAEIEADKQEKAVEKAVEKEQDDILSELAKISLRLQDSKSKTKKK